VVAAQNHDQIGNRARGERLSHLVSARRLQIAAALLLTAPFVPLLFQGEEWAASTPFHYFTAHEDEALGRQVAEGRRREFAAFGWDPQQILDPQELDTFAQSQLRWDERTTGVHAEMLAWHRALIQLRQQRPSLRDGRMADVRTWSDEERGLLHVIRGDVGIICNLSQAEITVDLPGAQTMLLASDAESQLTSGRLRLPHESVVLVDIANGDAGRPA
jgi:maltooligosyltrehalose trehalohydrolase